MRNIDELISRIKATVENHRLEQEGAYARWLWQDEKNSRELGINEYGCADAINLLYTINEFPRDSKSRENHIKVLQSLQNPETGLFTEETHHFIHTTAHCTAALELFDARPLYPFRGLEEYKTVDGLLQLLDGLNWKRPWAASHQGAGIYAALKLNEETDSQWEKAYFDWLWENADSQWGFWKKGVIGEEDAAPMYHYFASGFHYMFNLEYAKQPLRYPEKIIDNCLALYENKEIGNDFGKGIGFIDIDWIYTITRPLRQSGYRRDDCMAALREFAKEYLDWMHEIDYKSHDKFNDLHMLFGATCALAELQTALPGEIHTTKPLRLVLDRRPFI